MQRSLQISRFYDSSSREGNGTPLQCSCLENPRDGGAWWAAVYGVAQSQTRLKRLSSMTHQEHLLFCKQVNTHPSTEHVSIHHNIIEQYDSKSAPGTRSRGVSRNLMNQHLWREWDQVISKQFLRMLRKALIQRSVERTKEMDSL